MEVGTPGEGKGNPSIYEIIDNPKYVSGLNTQKKSHDIINKGLVKIGLGEINEQTIREYMNIMNIEGLSPSGFIELINEKSTINKDIGNLREHFLLYIENKKN